MFNKEDVIADIDATNIYYLYVADKSSLYDGIIKYFSQINNTSQRVKQFVDNLYSLNEITKEDLRTQTYANFKKASFVSSLLRSYNVSGTAYVDYHKACNYVFSDYLYDNYPCNIESITITNNKEENTITLGDLESFDIAYNLTPTINLKNTGITIESSNPEVATIENETIKIVGAGDVEIKVFITDIPEIYDIISLSIMEPIPVFEFDSTSSIIDSSESTEPSITEDTSSEITSTATIGDATSTTVEETASETIGEAISTTEESSETIGEAIMITNENIPSETIGDATSTTLDEISSSETISESDAVKANNEMVETGIEEKPRKNYAFPIILVGCALSIIVIIYNIKKRRNV